jgi:two-component system, OmpR family, sensor histidine kinase KdpD
MGGPAAADHGRAWRGLGAAVLLVGVTTAVGMAGRAHLMLADMVALYLLAITLCAAFYGRGPSLLTATLSVLAYDFFFIPPVFTFAVTDLRHIVTFAVMFVVGVVISGLTLRIRRHEIEARTREERTGVLYAFSQDLSKAEGEQEAGLLFAHRAREMFDADALVFVLDGTNKLTSSGASGADPASAEVQLRAAEDARSRGLLENNGAANTRAPELGFIPLRVGATPVGVLSFRPPVTPTTSEETAFLEAFVQQGALALHRARLKSNAEAAALKARAEEMKSTLLSTVSHDLRTPLAAITGAATTLRDDQLRSIGPERAELLETICEEAERLDRLVRNLLDMTKVEAGALQVKREWVPLEEIVGSALARVEVTLVGRPVAISLPPDLPLLSVDAVLFEQVFVNLLENAVKYTPAQSEIDIRAHAEGGLIVITVADRGPGVPSGTETRVFEKFFRTGATNVPGAGLGLAICRGVVEAHGGTITAVNRDGGGASFVIRLPAPKDSPVVPAEPAPVEHTG